MDFLVYKVDIGFRDDYCNFIGGTQLYRKTCTIRMYNKKIIKSSKEYWITYH